MKAPLYDERGTVFLEFLIVSIPLLGLVLGTLQMALLASAKLVTLQAARTSARAAVVVLNEPPTRYGGEPRGVAPPGSQRHAEIERAAQLTLLAVASAGSVNDTNAAIDALLTPRPAVLAPGGAGNAMVTFPGSANGTFARNGDVTVRVEIDYPCEIPLGRFFVCGGPRRRLSSEATLINQGAAYED